jgi:hypothetical protein
VHNLDVLSHLNLTPNPDKYPMLSPTFSPDPTQGTFAETHTRTLSIKDLDGEIAPGEMVVVEDEMGMEVVGTVFLMSGGGKGPVGKSKAKFRSKSSCGDNADEQPSRARTTQRGTAHMETTARSSSESTFVHRADISSDKASTPTVESDSIAVEPPKVPERSKRWSTEDSLHTRNPPLNAWTKARPKAILVPSVKFDIEILDKSAGNLSPFAPPYLENPVQVNTQGELVPEKAFVPSGPAPPPASTVSAWSKGPPTSVKKVTIAEKLENPRSPTSASHLAPPLSAVSLCGTESDPATPWDPAVRARKVAEAAEPASLNPEYPAWPGPSSFFPVDMPVAPSGAPTYPWGMPMSPVEAPGLQNNLLKSIPGGPGVMWTPAGWAVQDAAMKNALRSAEVKTKYANAKRRAPKTYFRSESSVLIRTDE